jgi:hypothetical protein
MPNPIDDWQSLLFFEADTIRVKPFEIEESRILVSFAQACWEETLPH